MRASVCENCATGVAYQREVVAVLADGSELKNSGPRCLISIVRVSEDLKVV